MPRSETSFNLTAFVGHVFNVSLGYFLVLVLLVGTFEARLFLDGKTTQVKAVSTCALPSVIDSALEITTEPGANTIDCRGEDIVITSTGSLVFLQQENVSTTFLVNNLQLDKESSISIQKDNKKEAGSLSIIATGEVKVNGELFAKGYSAEMATGTSFTNDGGTIAITTKDFSGNGGIDVSGGSTVPGDVKSLGNGGKITVSCTSSNQFSGSYLLEGGLEGILNLAKCERSGAPLHVQNTQDFESTIALELTTDQSFALLGDNIPVTVTAKNSRGEIDTSYTGTVQFHSGNLMTVLPARYSFTAADRGIHRFNTGIKVFEAGAVLVTIEDTSSSFLGDTASLSITQPDNPSLSIGVLQKSVASGAPVVLSWGSRNISNLSIDQGFSSVNHAGSYIVEPMNTTVYTLSGISPVQEKIEIATTVSIDTRALPDESKGSCPVINTLTASQMIYKKGEWVTLNWDTDNADNVSVNVLGQVSAQKGSARVLLVGESEISIFANKGSCQRVQILHLQQVSVYPWEGAGSILGLFLLCETLSFLLGGNTVWFLLGHVMNRLKNRVALGMVYDVTTGKHLVGASVTLWSSTSGKLIDKVTTNNLGIFTLPVIVGTYVVKVSTPKYIFPAVIHNADHEGFHQSEYRGTAFTISNEYDAPYLFIPLTRNTRSNTSAAISGKIALFIEECLRVINPTLLFSGFLYSVFTALTDPFWMNYLLVAVYLAVSLLRMAGMLRMQKQSGRLFGVTGKALGGVELGIYDPESKDIIAKTYTSDTGSYRFIVPNKAYTLRIVDHRYKLLGKKLSRNGMPLPRDDDRSSIRVVVENLLAYPVKSLEDTPPERGEKYRR